MDPVQLRFLNSFRYFVFPPSLMLCRGDVILIVEPSRDLTKYLPTITAHILGRNYGCVISTVWQGIKHHQESISDRIHTNLPQNVIVKAENVVGKNEDKLFHDSNTGTSTWQWIVAREPSYLKYKTIYDAKIGILVFLVKRSQGIISQMRNWWFYDEKVFIRTVASFLS